MYQNKMFLSKKSNNLRVDSQTSLEIVKRVLVFLTIVFTIVYSYMSFAFGLKFFLTAVVASIFAREVEILFLTHQRKMNRAQAKEHIYFTKPEVSGLLLALLLPVYTPLYITIVGIAFGVFITKMAFGGYSFNIFNIAISARVFIQASWPNIIGSAKATGLSDYVLELLFKPDYAKTSTLLTNNINFEHFMIEQVNWLSLILSAALLLGFIYLCINQVAKFSNMFWPVFFMIALFIIAGLKVSFALSFVSSPLVLLVLIFALNDPFTTANSSAGRLLLSSILAVVTAFMMLPNNNGFGILYALLFVNMLVSLVDAKLTLQAKYLLPLLISVILVVSASLILKNEASDTASGASKVVVPDSQSEATTKQEKNAPDAGGSASKQVKEISEVFYYEQ